MSTSERAGESLEFSGGRVKRARVRLGKRERLRRARHERLQQLETSDYRCATVSRPQYQELVTQGKRVGDDDDVGVLRGGGRSTHEL